MLCLRQARGALPAPHIVGALPAPREQLLTPHRPHEAARREAAQDRAPDMVKENGGRAYVERWLHRRWKLLIATKRSELHGCGRREENSSRGNRK